jgi:hypothetical protein
LYDNLITVYNQYSVFLVFLRSNNTNVLYQYNIEK